MEELTTFAQRVAWARQRKEDAGLTQDALAIRVGCSQSHIGHVESGRVATSKFIVEIAHHLEVDAYWLKTGKGKPERTSVGISDQALMVAKAFDQIPSKQQQSIVGNIEAFLELMPHDTQPEEPLQITYVEKRGGQKQSSGSF